MVTFVTIKATDPNYPARFTRKGSDGSVLEDKVIPAGFSFEAVIGPDQTASVVEEYHPQGWPTPAA